MDILSRLKFVFANWLLDELIKIKKNGTIKNDIKMPSK